MMGSSSVRLISDISALADVADVVSDPIKLKALRDELTTNLAANQESDKQSQARIDQAKLLEDTNKIITADLNTKKIDLDTREQQVKQSEAVLQVNVNALLAATTSLQEQENNLAYDKANFTQIKTSIQTDLENTKQKNQQTLDMREKSIKLREDAVAQREQLLTKAKSDFDAKSTRLSQALAG